MKNLILICALVFSAMPFAANASIWDIIGQINEAKHPRPQPPRPGYPGQVSCSYTDNGWEEHYGGHYSCGECLREHGNCTETCSVQTEVCVARGVDRYTGQLVSVSAESYDRWDAERRAYDSCYYRGLQDCRVEKCDTREQQTSRRSCRY